MADVFLLQFALYLWSNVVFGQSREDVVYTIDVVFVLESSQTSSKLIDRDRSQKLVWGRWGEEMVAGRDLMNKGLQNRRGNFFLKFKLFLREYQNFKREKWKMI